MANQERWCFAWFVPRPEAIPQAALVKAARWAPGSIIRVSFMDGDPAVQQKVTQVAKSWTGPGMANLTLKFVKPKTAGDIRISFKYEGSWSVIGTDCRSVPKNQPTMNYGWLDPTTADDEVRRVVLHEFGHAMGLIHEHQNPGGQINWNRDQVIHDLSGPPNNWSLDVINHNMFEPYSTTLTNFTAIDPSSIMMYPIPVKWTLDGFSVGLNTDLSPTDKQFIKEQYPFA
jgi:hypothetical protein